MLERPALADIDRSLALSNFLREGRVVGLSPEKAQRLVDGYFAAAAIGLGNVFLCELGWPAETLIFMIPHLGLRMPRHPLPDDPVYAAVQKKAGPTHAAERKQRPVRCRSAEDVQCIIAMMNDMGFGKEAVNGGKQQKYPDYIAALMALQSQQQGGGDGYIATKDLDRYFPKDAADFKKRLRQWGLIDIDAEADGRKLVRITPHGQRILQLLREAWERKQLPTPPEEDSSEKRIAMGAAQLMMEKNRQRIFDALDELSNTKDPDRTLSREQFDALLPCGGSRKVDLREKLSRLGIIVILTAGAAAPAVKDREKAKKKKAGANTILVRLTAEKDGGIGDRVVKELKQQLQSIAQQGTLTMNPSKWKKVVRDLVTEVLRGKGLRGTDRKIIVESATGYGDSLRRTLIPKPDEKLRDELRGMMQAYVLEEIAVLTSQSQHAPQEDDPTAVYATAFADRGSHEKEGDYEEDLKAMDRRKKKRKGERQKK